MDNDVLDGGSLMIQRTQISSENCVQESYQILEKNMFLPVQIYSKDISGSSQNSMIGSYQQEENDNGFEERKQQQQDQQFSSFTPSVEEDTTDMNPPNTLKKLNIRKCIAKLKQSKSKKFTKRNFVISPIRQVKLFPSHSFLLFSYMEIEGIYSDLETAESSNPFDLPSSCTIQQIETSQKDSIILKVQTPMTSGLKEFQFLIDHFEQLGTPSYLNLACLLRLYQEECRIQTKHLKELKEKIKGRIIDEEQVTNAIQEFQKYVQDYISKKYCETDFVAFCILTANPEEEDVNITSIYISNSFQRLMGIDLKQSQSTCFPDLVNLSQMLGLNRINQAASQLLLLLDNSMTANIDQDIVTADDIKLSTKMEFSCINWPERPSWMGQRDVIAYGAHVIIGENQIQAVEKIRRDRIGQMQLQLQFEQEVQREIFIEKFYPEIIQQSIKQQKINHKNQQKKTQEKMEE